MVQELLQLLLASRLLMSHWLRQMPRPSPDSRGIETDSISGLEELQSHIERSVQKGLEKFCENFALYY